MSLDLIPEHAYSPATFAKEYFSAMGVKLPQEKFKVSDRMNGIAEQALFAGRAECAITRTAIPVTYLDFHAQFPAVSTLLNCRELLCAEKWEFADFTEGARKMMECVTLEDCFRPEFWKQLRWYALVEPCGDVVPIRAKFGRREDSNPTLAWNFLSSKQPIWLTGLDVIAAKLITDKPLRLLKAIQVIPHGVQPGLTPVKLYSRIEVDPLRDDLRSEVGRIAQLRKDKTSNVGGRIESGS